MTTDEMATLNSSAGPAHREVTGGLALCGARILPGARSTTLLACAAWEIAICAGCWPARSSVYGGTR